MLTISRPKPCTRSSSSAAQTVSRACRAEDTALAADCHPVEAAPPLTADTPPSVFAGEMGIALAAGDTQLEFESSE